VALATETKQRIEEMINEGPVFLFMKGNPTFPQCGFSNQVCQILKAYEVPFNHFDVLSDPEIRQGIKDFADWPTIPQLYIRGEFVGGCDIVRESWESGELTVMLKDALPDHEISAPKPPAKPVNISPAEAKEMMDQGHTIYDVRTDEEREIAALEGALQLTQQAAQQILDTADKEAPLVFICHFGGRSGQAAHYFAGQGFQKVYNVDGGIDGWSQEVDSSIPRY
jgi:monothiol glutaredoxin